MCATRRRRWWTTRTNWMQKTAANNRQIHDVDDRAQAGISQAQGAADTANQNAQNASQAAGDAQIRRPTMRCIAPIRWTAW